MSGDFIFLQDLSEFVYQFLISSLSNELFSEKQKQTTNMGYIVRENHTGETAVKPDIRRFSGIAVR